MSSEEEEIRYRVHGYSWTYSPMLHVSLPVFGVIGDMRQRGINGPESASSNSPGEPEYSSIDVILTVLGSNYDDIITQRVMEQSAEEQELRRDNSVELVIGSQRYDTTDKNMSNCTICMREYEANDFVTCVEGCGHILCTECLREWGKYNPCCPICRKSIRTTR